MRTKEVKELVIILEMILMKIEDFKASDIEYKKVQGVRVVDGVLITQLTKLQPIIKNLQKKLYSSKRSIRKLNNIEEVMKKQSEIIKGLTNAKLMKTGKAYVDFTSQSIESLPSHFGDLLMIVLFVSQLLEDKYNSEFEEWELYHRRVKLIINRLVELDCIDTATISE